MRLGDRVAQCSLQRDFSFLEKGILGRLLALIVLVFCLSNIHLGKDAGQNIRVFATEVVLGHTFVMRPSKAKNALFECGAWVT